LKKSELTKKRIVEVAEDMFLKEAVNSVSMSKIAQGAGVAKGTLYLYFESKEDLVWAVTEKYLDDFMGILKNIENLPSSFESIDRVIDALFDFIHANEDKMKMIHQVSFHGYLGKDRMEKKYVETFKEPIEQWLSQGLKDGVFHVDHLGFAVDYIHTSVHNMIDSYILEESPYDDITIRTSLKTMIRKLLR
jgi:AcrR family transcriptional regulator